MKLSWLFGVLCVFVLAGCGQSATPAAGPGTLPTSTRPVETATAAVTPNPTPVATEIPTDPTPGQPADVKTAILAALDALDKNGPYRMTISAASDAEGPVILEVVPPDRSHYKGSLNGTPVEVIDIGNTSYVLNPDGSWETGSSTDSSASVSGVDLLTADTLTNAKLLPPKSLNGIATRMYDFVDTTSPEITVTLWVSQDKGLPVQMLMSSSDDVVVYEIKYDATITVVAPVK